jgi:quercetin dioxygenase-like cupin family protein
MKRAPNQPTSQLTLYAGIYLKTWSVPDAGSLVPQHAHRWPHLTLVISGAVRVWRDGVMLGDYRAPAAIKIPALEMHTFLTLTDDVILACVHATDAAEIEVAAEHQLILED